MKENKWGFRKLVKSFGYAFEGIKHGYTAGQNIIIMSILGCLAIILGLLFKIKYYEMLVILLLIGIILPLELLNTAIEATIDLHDGDKKSKCGKIAKDCSAGALTIASIIAFIIGLVIFLPRFIDLIF